MPFVAPVSPQIILMKSTLDTHVSWSVVSTSPDCDIPRPLGKPRPAE